MSNSNIGKYVALGVAAATGAGLVYLGVTVKRCIDLAWQVIELEEAFEEHYTKHGTEAQEELIKQYDQRTRSSKSPSWRKVYRDLLISYWEAFIAKKTQEEQGDVNPDE